MHILQHYNVFHHFGWRQIWMIEDYVLYMYVNLSLSSIQFLFKKRKQCNLDNVLNFLVLRHNHIKFWADLLSTMFSTTTMIGITIIAIFIVIIIMIVIAVAVVAPFVSIIIIIIIFGRIAPLLIWARISMWSHLIRGMFGNAFLMPGRTRGWRIVHHTIIIIIWWKITTPQWWIIVTVSTIIAVAVAVIIAISHSYWWFVKWR